MEKQTVFITGGAGYVGGAAVGGDQELVGRDRHLPQGDDRHHAEQRPARGGLGEGHSPRHDLLPRSDPGGGAHGVAAADRHPAIRAGG